MYFFYNNKLKIISYLMFLLIIWGYNKLSLPSYPLVSMSLSISKDGKHVISAHHGKNLVLWDIENKTSKLISTDANIFSAYFIPKSNNYIWQDIKDDIVHIENTNGEVIKTFKPGFASYGQLISKDFKRYVASDKNWNIFTLINNKKNQIKSGFNDFYQGKNINLSWEGELLLTSGICGHRDDEQPISAGLTARDINPKIREHVNYSLMNCIVLWDYQSGKAKFKLNGNSVKTEATLSPDGNYVVSGDEHGMGFVWDANTGKELLEQYDLQLGRYVRRGGNGKNYFEKNIMIPRPKDYCWKYSSMRDDCIYQDQVIAVKFINNDQYFRFTLHVPYVILYDVLNPNHKKFLKLEGNPSIHGFNEAAAISTAPEKNLLVMGSKRSEGIRVYQFDKEKETLTLVWAPDEIQRTFKQKLERWWKKLIA